MKIKNIFAIEKIEQQYFMVCLDSNVLSGMIQLNETAAFIVECLKEETAPEDIARRMSAVYAVNEEDALIGVNHMVTQLQQINALEE